MNITYFGLFGVPGFLSGRRDLPSRIGSDIIDHVAAGIAVEGLHKVDAEEDGVHYGQPCWNPHCSASSKFQLRTIIPKERRLTGTDLPRKAVKDYISGSIRVGQGLLGSRA